MADESAVSSPPQSLEAAALLAYAGWSYVLDRILAGVCHDLNGRVSSLQAVSQLIELGEPLPDTLNAEPGKLEGIVRFLALIPARLGADPTPCRVQDLVSRAVEFHGKVRGAIEEPPQVEFLEGLPPVLVNEGRIVRGMVLLLDHSMRSSPVSESTIRVSGDESVAKVVFPLGEAGIQQQDSIPALAELFGMDGGELDSRPGELVLQLPSLAASRAQGR